jgi:hypothetical protein
VNIVKAAAIFLLLLSFSRPHSAFAQEFSLPTQEITPTASPTAAPEYTLPYPGILPGNPLYVIKVIRDKLTEFLISEPEKKAKFELLQADKRLAASIDLFSLGKDKEAEETLSKSQNYLESSLNQIEIAKKSNKYVGEISAKALGSSEKQIRVIKSQTPKESGEIARKLKEDLERAFELQKKAKALNP